jgi:two-component system cell cycle sensor histidine kinase/response regulator CckA
VEVAANIADLFGQFESLTSLLAGLFAELPMGIQMYSADGRSLYVNQAFLTMFGVAPPPEYRIFDDEVAKETGAISAIRRAFAGESVRIPVIWYNPSDLKTINVAGGKRVAMETRAFPVFNSRREVTHVVFLIEDVTLRQIGLLESQRVMKQLNDANALLRTLVDGTKAVIYFKDLNSVFLMVNRQFEEIFKLKSEELVGKSGHDLFPKEVADTFRKNDLAVIAANSSQEIEEEVLHADGTRHLYISLKFPLYDSGGKVVGLCGISTDITQSKNLEKELNAARRMESLGLFAAGIAHDFNNILAVILLHAETLAGAQPIKRAAERASELTRKLLAFGRAQIAKPQTLDLNSTISNFLETLKMVVGKSIQIRLELASDLASIQADPSQIEQVFMNLCINARDAMNDHGNIEISTRNVVLTENELGNRKIGVKSGSYVEVAIRDDGQGMSSAVVEHIFEPFYSTKDLKHGTGLGLSSVLGIVDQYAGDIEVESEPGKGTTFRIYFPADTKCVSFSASPIEGESKKWRNGDRTLLLIDDEADLRKITAAVLRDRGYVVYEAADERETEAFARDQSKTFDLVICDVHLVNIDGPTMVGQFRQEGFFENTRFLFVSGYEECGLEASGLPTERQHFLEKPYVLAKLLAKVEMVLK